MRIPLEMEQEIERKKIAAYVVGHLPIVKSYAVKIGLVDIINELIPSKMDIDPGTIFLGMVMDTLSGRTPLYRLEEFFRDQDTELLFGKTINPAVFNDYNVGRVIDKAYAIGAIKIFSAISKRAVDVFEVNSRHVSFDTTSISVFGDYDLYDDKSSILNITQGHSKDHRPDLKQFLVSMLCVDRNVPVFGKTEDGNGSDKTINNTILTSISKRMALHGLEPGAFIYIADSAMVTKKNLSAIGDSTLFISRLPANYKECLRVIKDAIEKDKWQDLGILSGTRPTGKRPAAHYKAYESSVEIHGKKYRAVVIHSSAHDKRRQKRIDRELKSDRKALEQQCKVFNKKDFFCFADVQAAQAELSKTKCKYHVLNSKIEERPKYKRGRPKGGIHEIKEMRYGLLATVIEDEQSVSKLRQEAGCFVMLTNVPKKGKDSYDAKDILKAYKDQYGIEQNFGFLKDPVIVNSIFLKRPERVEVLGLVLLLSLLIWRLIEREMRQYVERGKRDLPGWKKRRTTRPTTFMLMTNFQRIMIIKIGDNRRLNKPFTEKQMEYLVSLKVDPNAFIKPGEG
ncbi:MAG: IS1634 family transposase [Thermodesulfobacteriota bacterium]|nr:IS1634 family transposase [Thermodesulfobacteriota bacterium]